MKPILIISILLISLALSGCSTNESSSLGPPGYTVIPNCINDCKAASTLIKSIDACIDKCYEIHFP